MAALGGNPWDGTEFRNLIRALRSDLLVVRAGITSRWSVMPWRGRLVTQARTHHSVQGGCVRMWGGGGGHTCLLRPLPLLTIHRLLTCWGTLGGGLVKSINFEVEYVVIGNSLNFNGEQNPNLFANILGTYCVELCLVCRKTLEQRADSPTTILSTDVIHIVIWDDHILNLSSTDNDRRRLGGISICVFHTTMHDFLS